MTKYIAYELGGSTSLLSPSRRRQGADEAEDAFLARVIAEGGSLPEGAVNPRVVTEEEALALTAPPPPSYRQLRAAAYIEQLPEAAPEGFQGATGDSIDALQKQVRLLAAAVRGLDPTFADDPDFATWASKIDGIKAEYPKP